MMLDVLLKIKDEQDHSLALRRSCRCVSWIALPRAPDPIAPAKPRTRNGLRARLLAEPLHPELVRTGGGVGGGPRQGKGGPRTGGLAGGWGAEAGGPRRGGSVSRVCPLAGGGGGGGAALVAPSAAPAAARLGRGRAGRVRRLTPSRAETRRCASQGSKVVVLRAAAGSGLRRAEQPPRPPRPPRPPPPLSPPLSPPRARPLPRLLSVVSPRCSSALSLSRLLFAARASAARAR